jgi:hypothetical protein
MQEATTPQLSSVDCSFTHVVNPSARGQHVGWDNKEGHTARDRGQILGVAAVQPDTLLVFLDLALVRYVTVVIGCMSLVCLGSLY